MGLRSDSDIEKVKHIMKLIYERPGITRSEMAEVMGVTYKRVKRLLDLSEKIAGYAVGRTKPHAGADPRSEVGYFMLRYNYEFFTPERF